MPTSRLHNRVVRKPATVLLAVAALAVHSASAGAGTHWGNVGTRCDGHQRIDYARLWDLAPFTDWVRICEATPAAGVHARANGKRPSDCVQKADSSVWAEWRFSNHPSCKSAPPANLTWGDTGQRCEGRDRVDFARLWGLAPGTNWKGICQQTPANGVSAGIEGKLPSQCIDKGGLGTWGEWRTANHASCGARFEAPQRAGCTGPDNQVYSARLTGTLPGDSWEDVCASTPGPNDWGTPQRCVKDAFNTGIRGEWYTSEQCRTKLEWGRFRDNGCVKDMKTQDLGSREIADVNGLRSYSAVLWNAGGDWMRACRSAPIDVMAPNGQRITSATPSGCVIADANDSLSWVLAPMLGAAGAFVPVAAGASAAVIASTGAAVGLASKGAEELLLGNVDTSLNVWGIFWVVDESCGTFNPGSALFAQGRGANAPQRDHAGRPAEPQPIALPSQVHQCPANANGMQAPLTCKCETMGNRFDKVWGSGPYTSDSSICKAAVHAGLIGASGGVVTVRPAPGLPAYAGSIRNGVSAESYRAWRASFELTP